MTVPLPARGWYPDRSAALPIGAPAQAVVPQPKDDPFYTYAGDTPLKDLAPGTVLATRSISYHILGIPTALKTTQLLYRSTAQTGAPSVNVTSVIQPLGQRDKTKVISYQSAYDSLNRNDQPSYAISGGLTLGGVVPNVELAVFGLFLAQGCTVIVPDTEGQRADFAAGPEYGMNTLDSLRAAFRSSTVGLPSEAKVALLGYSGGAIASEWAAELAPTYASDVNGRMIGAAIGGLLVHPAHNLRYIEGTYFWAGVMPMALIGISRAFDVDFTPYLTARGQRLYHDMQATSIVSVLARQTYWRLTWSDLVVPAYPTPESLPLFVKLANRLIMGTGGTPTIPLFIGQGANGELEWTPGDTPGIGPGDGVMIAGDVRTLARTYCAEGTAVHYEQYDSLSHLTTVGIWLVHAINWINDRFAGQPAPQNCSAISPGNPLDPIPLP
ncbi:lipase family protein [Mycolicibacterium hodleri]|uniref:Triacylglycerol lipase n=1 Tax=Mycolicibacterium hodleri TaxID=49897 RepID=A0A502EG82_9MYCO|nr:lipase family protein [Mycolicibacterium hodleri]TPG36698.1 triacylglycerol lipase [Mycolicibacterium hodleri]